MMITSKKLPENVVTSMSTTTSSTSPNNSPKGSASSPASASPKSSPGRFTRKFSARFFTSQRSGTSIVDIANSIPKKLEEGKLEDILYSDDLDEIDDFDFQNPLLRTEEESNNNNNNNPRPSSGQYESSPTSTQTKSDKPLQRVHSIKRFLTKDKPLYEPTEYTSDMSQLEQLILDKSKRNELVRKFLSIDSDYAVKVRFCSAVWEYKNAEDKVEKKEKGKKIVGMFICPNAMFKLEGHPPILEQFLVQGKYDVLEEVKNGYLSEIIRNQKCFDVMITL